jgi:hypothetical protein
MQAEDFKFDTSGAVIIEHWPADGSEVEFYRFEWSDLSPFEQGYVEALLASLRWWIAEGPRNRYGSPTEARRARFSDLAPSTLARIREDCGRFTARFKTQTKAKHGAGFWRERNRGFYGVAGNRGRPAFPPLTPFLSDDGKVRLREDV